MKLKAITFTGVDDRTDPGALKDIQKRYPLVEWGVLTARSWADNGPRYPDPQTLGRFRGLGLNMSCHVCGSVARQIVRQGSWWHLVDVIGSGIELFSRCQLNVAGETAGNGTRSLRLMFNLDEVIIQQRGPAETQLYDAVLDHSRVSVLLDPSGGRGLVSDFVPLERPGVKVGYAGGLTPDNVAGKLRQLLEDSRVEDFWIDMESGVRTSDRFDLGKVEAALRACYDVLSTYSA